MAAVLSSCLINLRLLLACMTVARQEMERDNLDYKGLEIIITFALALFTHKIAYAQFDAFLTQVVGFEHSHYC